MAAKKEPEKSVAEFHKANGPADCYRPYKAADAKRLGARLHPAFRLLAETDGWASYADQALWLCDPDDWRGVADAWMEKGSKAPDVVMRTGYGDMIVWDGSYFWLVMPHESARMRMSQNAEWLLGYSFQNPDSYFREYLPDMMRRGKEEAGPLTAETIYAYVPALALGGSEEDSKIEAVKAREQLSILSQLEPVAALGI